MIFKCIVQSSGLQSIGVMKSWIQLNTNTFTFQVHSHCHATITTTHPQNSFHLAKLKLCAHETTSSHLPSNHSVLCLDEFDDSSGMTKCPLVHQITFTTNPFNHGESEIL